MSSQALVQIRDVHKHFTRGSDRIDVLKGVNLDIREGDFLGLMGPSGSGKTTILRIIAGLEQPYTGKIILHGKEVTELPAREPCALTSGPL